ncbi:hypothetical protein L917_01773 [Phytophthora nicotianae]|uniref:Uncharacterized protein n=1 Tax=Phytophthora nicotianae TaxID=4792 RepID=W2LW27_PHYNI|nr:hypothetical protein L917_01773 [Phytophthora nicotianae]
MEYHCHTKVIAMDYAYKTIKYNLPLLNILSLTEGKTKEGHLEGEPFQQKGRLVRQKNDTQALFDFK